MAIISSNIGDNDFSLRKKELRLVDSTIIPEEKRNNNLHFSSGIIFESTNLSSFLRREKSLSPKLEEIIAIMKC